MPHPKRIKPPKIPRFSAIVKSEAPALESPHAHENKRQSQKFNPNVAVYTFAFVATLLGGLYIGASSKNWQVYPREMGLMVGKEGV
jgi:hypothetical protein